MTRIVLSPEAERDLEDIKRHLLSEANATVTRHVLRELRGAIQFLAAHPGAGHTRSDLTKQAVRFWPVFSYLIIYTNAAPFRVVRILHGARDVETLLR